MIRLFRHYLCRETLLQVSFDVGLIVLVMMALDITPLADWPLPAAATHGLSLAGGVLIINSTSGLYQTAHGESLLKSLVRALFAMAMGLMLVYALFSALPATSGHGISLQFAAMIGVAGIIAHRVYANLSGNARRAQTQVLIFGSGEAAKTAGEALMSSSIRAHIAGYFPAPNEVQCDELAGKVLTGYGSLRECAVKLGVGEIVVALSERRGGSMPLRDLLECKIHGIKISDISTHFEKISGQIKIDYLKAGWLIFGEGFHNRLYHAIVKQIVDVVVATALIALTAPLMLVIALLIRIESKGPILYRQERVGRDGKPYPLLKFRSMRSDAEKDGIARWATASDDRITKVGKVIRKYRIDELPQLLNVLKGEMSLVGPRPERPVFVEQLIREVPFYSVRHSLKPGITGWAQVRYQYGASLQESVEKLQYDLYYVKNHTLFLDLLIMLQTVGVVLSGKGAR